MTDDATESRRFHVVVGMQMRMWARFAGVAVVLSNIAMALFGESFWWIIAALDVGWAIALVLGATSPLWLVVAGALSVAQLSLFGWAGASSFILLVAGLAMRLGVLRGLVATAVFWAVTALGLLLWGDHQPPAFEMRPFDLLFATANIFLLGALMRTSVISRSRAESLAEQLGAAHEMLRRDLGATEALAAAQERTRIAHELHDNLGHSLATAHVHTQLVRRLVGDGDRAVIEAIEQVVHSTRQAMHALRDAVSLLRHRTDGAELGPRIRTMLERLPNAVLDHTLVVHGVERPLSPAKEFALYRALQEAMTNVVKHARAQRVCVTLTYSMGGVALDVEDDGVGTDELRHGFGLRGMAERLEAVGGRLVVTSTAGRGFCLHVEVESR